MLKRGGIVIGRVVLVFGLALLASALVWAGMLWRVGGVAGAAVQAHILYVAPDGECDGASPCYASIQAAVDAALPGDEIRVRAGVYSGVQTRPALNGPAFTATQVVAISKSLILRGGYASTDWTVRDAREYPSVVDAQGQGRAVLITGALDVRLDGLFLTGGQANQLGGGAPDELGAGGGLYAANSDLTLRDSQVVTNVALLGGGIFVRDSTALLEGNTVAGHQAALVGAGLYAIGGRLALYGNTIARNTAISGGGAYMYSGEATLVGNSLVYNTGRESYGALMLVSSRSVLRGNRIVDNAAANSGAIGLLGGEATLSHNEILSNTYWFSGEGGGLYCYLAGVQLTGNRFAANEAYAGGGVDLHFCRGVLQGNTFVSNVAHRGGGLQLYDSDLRLVNNLIADNQAGGQGDGIYVYISHTAPTLVHTTLARNGNASGTGIYVAGDMGSLHLTNTILVSHSVGISVTAGNAVLLHGTLWGEGAWANGRDWGGAGTLLTDALEVWGDPAFLDPDGGDYHIGPASAAVDRAIPAGVGLDIDFEPRLPSAPDLGADEYWPPGALYYHYLPLFCRLD